MLRKRGDVAKAEIEPLPGQRVNEMRRVAHQRQTLADVFAGETEAERIGLDAGRQRDRPQLQREPAFNLAQQVFGMTLQHDLGVRVAFVPDNARLASGHGQDCERSGGQEVLFGPSFVFAFMRDRGDDRALSCIPA